MYCPVIKGICNNKDCLKRFSYSSRTLENFCRFSTASHNNDKCCKCNSILKQCDFLCKACSTFQDLSNYSYFDIFFNTDISVSKQSVSQLGTFDVDLAALKKNFYSLQQKYHPDNLKVAADSQTQDTELISSFLNKGYNTLKDPFDRANYLLSINGSLLENVLEIEDCDAGRQEKVSQSFLSKIIELREVIEENEIESEQVQSVYKESLMEVEKCIEDFKRHFKDNNYNGCISIMNRWKYWKNIVDDLGKR